MFATLTSDADYLPTGKSFLLNFLSGGLGQLIRRVEAEGIAGETRGGRNVPNIGRFARIRDPEGSPIESLEPPAEHIEGGSISDS